MGLKDILLGMNTQQKPCFGGVQFFSLHVCCFLGHQDYKLVTSGFQLCLDPF